jgi:hypothetical protein
MGVLLPKGIGLWFEVDSRCGIGKKSPNGVFSLCGVFGAARAAAAVEGTALSSWETFLDADGSLSFGEGASLGVESDKDRAFMGDFEGVRTAYNCDIAC